MKIISLLFILLACQEEKHRAFDKDFNTSFTGIKNYQLDSWGEITCKNNKNATFIQSPHSYADLFTKEIAKDLFLKTKANCLYQNAVPRKYKFKHSQIKADIAHLKEGPVNQFTKFFCNSLQNCHVIQIHGFSQKKRKSKKGKEASIILSSGKNTVDNKTYKTWNCLRSKFPDTFLFPLDIKELGATKNEQKKVVQANNGEFTHIEISHSLRKEILKNLETKKLFHSCF